MTRAAVTNPSLGVLKRILGKFGDFEIWLDKITAKLLQGEQQSRLKKECVYDSVKYCLKIYYLVPTGFAWLNNQITEKTEELGPRCSVTYCIFLPQ